PVGFGAHAELHRLDPAGQWASGWPAGGFPLGSVSLGSSLSANSSLVPGTGGAVHALWRAFGHEVRAMLVTPAGTIPPGWAGTGVVVLRDTPVDAASLAAVPDGAGGFLLTCDDAAAPARHILATHRTAAGDVAPGWPVALQPVVADSLTSYPALAPDGL